MAINVIRLNQIKSLRNTEATFRISKISINNKINGRISRSECPPNSTILTVFKEEVLVKYLLDKDDKGFGINLANLLLKSRGAPRVGTLWPQRFVQRKPELQIRISRAYNF